MRELPKINTSEYTDLNKVIDQRSQQYGAELARMQTEMNQVYAYLENQAVEAKHGDTLNDLQPYIQQVTQELGQDARFYPRQRLIQMAAGARALEEMAATATQTQSTEQQAQADKQHRDKVMAASVEPANGATKVAPKVVETSKMNSEELGMLLDSQVVPIVTHD